MKIIGLRCIDFVSPKDYGSLIAKTMDFQFIDIY
jgi:hypothetical protein